MIITIAVSNMRKLINQLSKYSFLKKSKLKDIIKFTYSPHICFLDIDYRRDCQYNEETEQKYKSKKNKRNDFDTFILTLKEKAE